MKPNLRFSVALALAAALAASPAAAQKGKGNGNGNGNGNRSHAENVRRDRDRDDDDRWERRRDDDDRRYERRRRDDDGYIRTPDGRRIPRGWCQGRGNPHNTPANCGYSRNDRRRVDDRVIYDRRRTDGSWLETLRRRSGTTSTTRRTTSTASGYEAAHDRYHRTTMAECRRRINDRPLDRAYQRRIAEECNRRHEAWHRTYEARYNRR